MFCIRKNICSHGKKNLLFLPRNMAAVQNLYTLVAATLIPLSSGQPTVRERINYLFKGTFVWGTYQLEHYDSISEIEKHVVPILKPRSKDS